MKEPLEIPFAEFDEYIRQGEPDQKEKAGIWSVAIGLQQVDGLQTSDFLRQTAKLLQHRSSGVYNRDYREELRYKLQKLRYKLSAYFGIIPLIRQKQ